MPPYNLARNEASTFCRGDPFRANEHINLSFKAVWCQVPKRATLCLSLAFLVFVFFFPTAIQGFVLNAIFSVLKAQNENCFLADALKVLTVYSRHLSKH